MKKSILFLLFLSACTQLNPFVDARREAGQVLTVGQSTPDRIAICYNPLWADMDEVQKLADEACAQTQRKAQPDGEKYFTCTLVSPVTTFYKCI